MKTLKEFYCEKKGCSEDAYEGELFWRCLYRRAIPLVPFFRGMKSDFFSADRRLIAEVGRSQSMSQVMRHIAFFGSEWDNRRRLRRILKIRVSARRVKDLVEPFFTEQAAGSPDIARAGQPEAKGPGAPKANSVGA